MQPTRDVYVTCPFGTNGSWAAGYHTGIDFRADVGTRIFATKYGKVIHVGRGGYGRAYGKHIIIQSWYRGRRRQHLYAHLSDILVRPGQKVRTGAWIAKSGNTGNTTGPHLHYEERVSPFSYWSHTPPLLPNWRPRRRPVVHLSRVRPGKKNKEIKRVQRKLNKKFPGLKSIEVSGFFNNATEKRYSLWQKRLGYDGKDANGIPGRDSLKRLGFRVRP